MDSMSEKMAQAAQVLAGEVTQLFGPPLSWRSPSDYGYPTSLALCVIDAIHSMGVRYGSVRLLVGRYQELRLFEQGDPFTDGSIELLESFHRLGGCEAWADRLRNRHKTHTHSGAPLKACVVEQAAGELSALGIQTAQDLRSQAALNQGLESNWRRLPSQASGISWRYLLMLAGVPGVKPDRMIMGFLAKELPADLRPGSTREAVEMLECAASDLGVSSTLLDHRIWLHQSGRRPGVTRELV